PLRGLPLPRLVRPHRPGIRHPRSRVGRGRGRRPPPRPLRGDLSGRPRVRGARAATRPAPASAREPMTPDERRYYATQSRVSDPEERTALLDALPADPGRLVAAVSGLVLPPLFVGPLGIAPAAGSEDDVECRRLPRILDRIVARDPGALPVPR